MAASDKGVQRIASRPHSQRCSGTNARGAPCGAWALRGGDLCYRHSIGDAEWSALGRRGGKNRQQARRERAGIRDMGRHRYGAPEPTLARAIEVVGELLDATLPDGSGEANYEARAYGVLALALLFKTPERPELLELLARFKPQLKLAHDPQRARLLDLERAQQALLAAYDAGRISAFDLPPELLKLRKAAEIAA